MKIASEERRAEILSRLKSLRDQLDLFSQDVEFSLSGRRYPFFSSQFSAKAKTIKKLIEYDLLILERTCIITDTCRKIGDYIFVRNEIDFVRELKKVREYLIEVRNLYKDRIDLIKNIN